MSRVTANQVGTHEDFFDYVGIFQVGRGAFFLYRWPYRDECWRLVLKGAEKFHELPLTWCFT